MYDVYYTLITGASEGLGKNFVIECAKRHMHIIAVALPGPELESLKSFISRNFSIQMEIVAADLSTEEGCKRVYETVQTLRLRINMLINNAGVVMTQPFHEMPLENMLLQARLNVLGTTMMTKYFINDLLANQPSYLLNVSSLSAYFHLPNKQMYGASKAFVYSFTRGLQAEYHNKGISITVVCPGGLSSNIRSVLANNQGGWIARRSITTPEFVAAKAVQACLEGKEVVIPGRLNRLFLFLNRLLPASIKVAITTAQMKKLTVKKSDQ
jgi:hypothetical protein